MLYVMSFDKTFYEILSRQIQTLATDSWLLNIVTGKRFI